MRNPVRRAALAALFALPAGPAVAAPITFDFTGVIAAVDSDLSAAFAVGQLVSGSYTFESTTPSSAALPGGLGYGGAITGGSVTAGSSSFSLGGGTTIDVMDGAFGNPLKDWYTAYAGLTGASAGTYDPEAMLLRLIDNDGDMLASDDLPGMPPPMPLGVDDAIFFVLDFRDFGADSLAQVTIDLTSLTLDEDAEAVPEPATLVLVAWGIAAARLRRAGRGSASARSGRRRRAD